MKMLKNPVWLQQHIHPYTSFGEVPQNCFDQINARLDRQKKSDLPLVSIVIAAWNEEINLLNCISSLSAQETDHTIEIIVVNNNSTDNTQKTIDKLALKSVFQPIQGCGPARQLGQESASGVYILLADADCIYPLCWVNEMISVLGRNEVVCVYGRYSFISEKGFPRWKLFILERLKDIIAEIRHFKRPYLNAYGISMGYIRELGLKVGYVMHQIRGEDGRLCFDLMAYGKVKQVRANRARAWTPPRTLRQEGTFGKALVSRVKVEFKRLGSLLKPHPPHDTKTSSN